MLETLKATAKTTSEGLKIITNAREFEILLDEPEEEGGTNTGMNPVEAVLCAFGACQAIVAKMFAPSQDFEFEEFYIELEGDLDPDGFMGLAEDVRNGLQEVRFKVHFKTDESQEKAEAFAQFIEKTCPVGDCLAAPVKLVRTGVVID